MVSFEEDLRLEDPHSCDSPKVSVLEDLRWEVAQEGQKLERVWPSAHQRVLPTEVVLREAGCHMEVRGVLVASRKEQHCRTVIEVALAEKGPSYQAASAQFLHHKQQGTLS